MTAKNEPQALTFTQDELTELAGALMTTDHMTHEILLSQEAKRREGRDHLAVQYQEKLDTVRRLLSRVEGARIRT